MNAQQGLGIALAAVGYVVTGGNPLGASLGYAVGATAGGAIDRANAESDLSYRGADYDTESP